MVGITGILMENFCDEMCWEYLLGLNASLKFTSLDRRYNSGTCEDRLIKNEIDYNTRFDLEPINSWTSFSYILVGNFFVSKSLGEGEPIATTEKSSNMFTHHPIWPRLLGIAYLLTGVGSFSFHMSLSLFGEFMDYANILFTSFFVSYIALVDYYEPLITEEMYPNIAIYGWIFSLVVTYTVVYKYSRIGTYILSPLILFVSIWSILFKE